ncbi:MAG: BREX system Lon protease-like protein BrxL [Anaerolineae bacterium]
MTEYPAQNKVNSVFSQMAVFKTPERSKQFAALNIPPYLRDWLVMRFSDDNGVVDMHEVMQFVRSTIPRREDWEPLKAKMVNEGVPVRFLARMQVEIDVSTGEALFSLPDFGFPRHRHEAVVSRDVIRNRKDELLASSETWGVVNLEWGWEKRNSGVEVGTVSMTDFAPFQPYRVDVDFFQQARSEFSLDEWVDVLLLGVDYNPTGFISMAEKMTLLTRLLPFVEKRVNLVELAPKGTGKSYMFSQLSKHGWLVSGGSISRARMFHNIASNTPGLIKRYDFVALDEVQTITFTNDDEVKGALKGFMESGEYRIGEHHGNGEAGIILLGNINQDRMNENDNVIRELPPVFQESALIDRFHGFIRGWDIPRMRENLKAEGWGLNTEYLTEMFHLLRNDVRYRSVVDGLLSVPRGADTRDTEAVKRIATAYTKLLFPDVTSPDKADRELFHTYCLEPALDMRGVIRRQLHMMDLEYSSEMPGIECRVVGL